MSATDKLLLDVAGERAHHHARREVRAVHAAYFIRCRGDECSIVKLHLDGGEENLEHGLTLVDAETLYFTCIGEPVYEGAATGEANDDADLARRRRPRQLVFKF
jgi:hypothetical protein